MSPSLPWYMAHWPIKSVVCRIQKIRIQTPRYKLSKKTTLLRIQDKAEYGETTLGSGTSHRPPPTPRSPHPPDPPTMKGGNNWDKATTQH